MSTPSWTDYLFGFARQAATKSKDETQVGAVLIGKNREILLTGFNGPPIGVAESPKRRERSAKYLYVAHAEANLIAFAARNGIQTEGCSVFVTHSPCSGCAKLLIQAGIKSVHFLDGKTSMPPEEFTAAKEMMFEAGISLHPWHNN